MSVSPKTKGWLVALGVAAAACNGNGADQATDTAVADQGQGHDRGAERLLTPDEGVVDAPAPVDLPVADVPSAPDLPPPDQTVVDQAPAADMDLLQGCHDYANDWGTAVCPANMMCSNTCSAWPGSGKAPSVECGIISPQQVYCTCSAGGPAGVRPTKTIYYSAGAVSCGTCAKAFNDGFCGLYP